MGEVAQLSEIASLVGDPARANIMSVLMDGRAHTASELAYLAHVAAPTASGHLAKLRAARLIALARQGRHHYYRLASPEVARMIEAIGAVAAAGPPRRIALSRHATALREARTCYDHLAGRVAVAIADRLVARGDIVLSEDGGEVADAGADFLARFGLDLTVARARKRAFCRPCLDWTERRPHLGGAVGAALLCRCASLGWIERVRDSRAVRISPAGRAGFTATFGVDVEAGRAVA
jgi:DNA-binding transcriptional ArsR family regulator